MVLILWNLRILQKGEACGKCISYYLHDYKKLNYSFLGLLRMIPLDVVRLILVNSNMEAIMNAYRVNKWVYNALSKEDFWQEKLSTIGLPKMILDESYTTLRSWVALYYYSRVAYSDAECIMYMSKLDVYFQYTHKNEITIIGDITCIIPWIEDVKLKPKGMRLLPNKLKYIVGNRDEKSTYVRPITESEKLLILYTSLFRNKIGAKLGIVDSKCGSFLYDDCDNRRIGMYEMYNTITQNMFM